jgi:uncharacterized Zn-finger protein
MIALLKFHNQPAVPEIRIGARQFNSIGALPPQDHPHVYLAVLCPYCWTLFRFDARPAPTETDPADCHLEDTC